MKKKLLFGCMIILSLFFVGCTKTIELTDDENYMIAEYAAELLLKYDSNIDLKYYDDEIIATPMEPEEITEMTTTENVVTEAETTEVTTEETMTGTVIREEEVTGVEADTDSSFDIAKFAGEDKVSICYAYYMILDSYPSYDQEGVYIEIEAPAGYKLLVLKFDVENKTNDSQYIDMYSKDLEYNIIINNKKSAKQMLTILIDDLYTYQATIDASMREETVLLFQVSESIADQINDLKLKVSYQGENKVIQLSE